MAIENTVSIDFGSTFVECFRLPPIRCVEKLRKIAKMHLKTDTTSFGLMVICIQITIRPNVVISVFRT